MSGSKDKNTMNNNSWNNKGTASGSPMSIFGPLVKYKKAPQAPKRFKSSYMFFSTYKHKEIRAELSKDGEMKKINTTEVAKMVSKAWKAMPEDEREKWENIARKDKARYELEKSVYTGPWKVPIVKSKRSSSKIIGKFDDGSRFAGGARRSNVHRKLPPPKRPITAFEVFSNANRTEVKRKHGKNLPRKEISKIIAQMWEEYDPIKKQVYIEKELASRKLYETAMFEWKKTKDDNQEAAGAYHPKDDDHHRYHQPQYYNNPYPENSHGSFPRSYSLESATSSTTTSSRYSTKMAEAIFEERSSSCPSTSANCNANASTGTNEGIPIVVPQHYVDGSTVAAAALSSLSTPSYPSYGSHTIEAAKDAAVAGSYGSITHPFHCNYYPPPSTAHYGYRPSEEDVEGNNRVAEQPQYHQQYPHSYPYQYHQYPYGYGYERPPLPPPMSVSSSPVCWQPSPPPLQYQCHNPKPDVLTVGNKYLVQQLYPLQQEKRPTRNVNGSGGVASSSLCVSNTTTNQSRYNSNNTTKNPFGDYAYSG